MPTLMSLFLACATDGPAIVPRDTGPSDDTAPPDDTAAPDDTAEVPPFDIPWVDEEFWLMPGPLDPLITADVDDPSRTWFVRMATSVDGETWVEHEQVVISDFNSLDLFITDDGVVLTGLVDNAGFMLHAGSVYAIASADLTTWASHEWPISNPTADNLVDPSLHVRWDGTIGLSYYACDEFGVDPVLVEGDHDIRRAWWTGRGWEEDPEPAFSHPWLVDPVICALDGEEWLFATKAATEIVAARGNGDGTFTLEEALGWADHTVPYCFPEEGALALYGQTIGVTGLPEAARMDGATLVDEGAIIPEHLWGTNNCSSPVMGKYKDQYVLFCAVNAALARQEELP